MRASALTREGASDLCLSVSDAVVRVLRDFERTLDPAVPEDGGRAQIIGYGEVSSVFALAALQGQVCKRMAGFRDAARVQDYLDVVGRYIRRLHDVGVHVVATAAVPIAVEGRAPVVYLLQPRLDGAGLGNAILRSADDRTLCARLDAVLGDCRRVLLANRAPVDDRTATVDGQLSNWHFDRDLASPPLLIDVGTPFMRRHGAYEIDIGLFLAPAPPVVRQLFRRLRIVETYLDTFFDPRLLLVDLLGNFHKEGRPDRIDAAVAHVNTWLRSTGSDLGVEPIARAEVDRYYSKDAKLLEFYLKVRRLDRFVRTRIFRRVYPFVLPGPIRR